ncbi:TlpA family protein disulfide reductase [Mucilaginibacter flavidus]|uniref:TlpA family protein disulfide reductase n=1 Tax=Mucilaginibacter flavidus TaxID=2949309 RepID=UPI0020929DC4|nr:TlpA disulfide reductase family protein [Mucilaginibacter flavidus]MCO5949538.1 TlpA family protein disulfide reductase [Mucilaginibacter flavidus]
MKKIALSLSLISIAALNGFAQFKLSGRIKNYRGTDSVVLNIPFVYGNYTENNVKIPVESSGVFNFTVPVKSQKFVNFSYKNLSETLLLRPGKSLSLVLDTTGKVLTITGTAANENRVFNNANLNEIPFFLKYDNQQNPYAKMHFDELQEKLVKPWFSQRDEKIANVIASKLTAGDKKLIVSEINYQALVQLNYFAYGVIYADKKLVNKFISTNYGSIGTDPAVSSPGLFYSYFADGYINYINGKIFAEYGPADERSKAPFLSVYHISLDSAMALGKRYGNSYVHWFLFKQYFKKKVAEQYLAQTIWRECRENDISQIKPLMTEFETNFPKSIYINVLRAKVRKIELFNKQNESLKNINVFDGYEKVNSIYEVVNAFKGKVIYLDLWGTWCGPCKKKLLYGPELKQHFKDKDVVFVYLDMDEDDKDADWKKFIRLNGVTGIHLRKSRADIGKFWDELLSAGHERLYPSYFIFDKTGKLVQADTKRPSDGTALYTELEKYL